MASTFVRTAIFSIAFLLAAANFAFAENQSFAPSGASLSKLVSGAYGGLSYSIPAEFSDNGTFYYLVQFKGGQSIWVKLWQEENQTLGQFVSDELEAQKAVSRYNKQRGISGQILPLLTSASSRLDGTLANFTSSQAECRRLMGISKTPCNSFDSCKKACFGVPSFCGQIALGIGEKFIYGIWEYENDTAALISLQNETAANAAAALKHPYQKNIQNLASSLERLELSARRMTSSNLLVKEMYCKPAPINVSRISQARLEVAQALGHSTELSSEKQTAASFAQAGKEANGNATLPFELSPKVVAQPLENQTPSAEFQPPQATPPTANAATFNISAILPAAAVVFGVLAAGAIAGIMLLRGKERTGL